MKRWPSEAANEQIWAQSHLLEACHDSIDALVKANATRWFAHTESTPDQLSKLIKDAIPYWSTRNALIADVLKLAAEKATGREAVGTCMALTSYLIFYVVRYKSPFDGENARWRHSVRLAIPPKLSIQAAGEEEDDLDAVGKWWFPWDLQPEKRKARKEFFLAFQYTMADASFNALIPSRGAGDHDVADVMLSILTGQPLVFHDVGEMREVYTCTLGEHRLSASPIFGAMNIDVGIRSELFLPVGYDYHGRPQGDREPWIEGFAHATPFCIQLFSPVPGWYRADDTTPIRGAWTYSRNHTEVAPSFPGVGPPDSPALVALQRTLSLACTYQQLSETRAMDFLGWMADLIHDQAFAALVARVHDEWKTDPSTPTNHAETQLFVDWASRRPDVVARHIIKTSHGALFGYLADLFRSNIDRPTFPHLELDPSQCMSVRGQRFTGDEERVLSVILLELTENHQRYGQGQLYGHWCADPIRNNRTCFHLLAREPGDVSVQAYMNLRQGQPTVYLEEMQAGVEASNRVGGMGLSLARHVAEMVGFQLVVELGRDLEHGPDSADFTAIRYRHGLHWRLYVT